jgi:Resolvase, N terminal domain
LEETGLGTRYIYLRSSGFEMSLVYEGKDVVSLYPDALIIQQRLSVDSPEVTLSKLIESMVRGDSLIVASLVDFGLSTKVLLEVIETLEKKGVNFIASQEGIDSSTSQMSFAVGIIRSIAELERNLASSRSKAGVRGARSGKGRRSAAQVRCG